MLGLDPQHVSHELYRASPKMWRSGPFDHVIEVDMKLAAVVPGTRLSIDDKLHIKVAEQLGLLEHKCDMADAELRYYTYDMEKKQDDTVSPSELKYSIALQIMQNLRTKKYLLVVHNLDRPIRPIVLDVTTEGLWLPAPRWKDSFWIVSTTSQDVYDRSNKRPSTSLLRLAMERRSIGIMWQSSAFTTPPCCCLFPAVPMLTRQSVMPRLMLAQMC